MSLRGGSQGVVWYDLAQSGVDPAAATDTAALTSFTLLFAGQTLTEANATFTVSPVAEFEYGDLVDIKFTVVFATPVAGLESLVAANGQVTGIDSTTHNPGNPVELQWKEPPTIFLDFQPMAFPQNGVEWTVVAEVDGKGVGTQTFTIPGNATPAPVREAMKGILVNYGLQVEFTGTTGLNVRAAPRKQLTAVTILANLNPLPAGPAGRGLNLRGTVDPVFTYRKPWFWDHGVVDDISTGD